MNKQDYDDYCIRVEANLAGIEAVSTGACPGCRDCGVPADDQLICDDQSLVGAKSGTVELRVWDDGFGDLYLYGESLGPLGLVRADTWESAWESCVDEIMDDGEMPADPDIELDECEHWRSSGEPSNPDLHSPVAREDPNGSYLWKLTPELAAKYNITVEVSPTAEELYEAAHEGHGFSFAECDACGTGSAGARYPMHGLIGGELWHGWACADCVYYLEYGVLDDLTMMEIED